MKLLIFRKTSALSVNAGGPNGYLHHLREGLRHDTQSAFVPAFIEDGAPSDEAEKPHQPKKSRLGESLARLRRKFTSKLFCATGFPPKLDPLIYREKNLDLATQEALAHADIAHAHTTRDADRLIRLRQSGKWTGKIILSSHSPEAPALETANLRRPKGYSESYYAHLEACLLRRDLEAFRESDAWIFPSRGAMDPYFETLPGFAELAESKLIRFVPTGILPPAAPTAAAVQKRRVATGDEIQICFIGRHESVKGYDLFCAAALRLLATNPRVRIVCAGVGRITAPEHPRWHELGRINDVQALLHASDLFVLPNRRTYYDLILLEALAAGVPILATNTGGNRDVAKETEAILLCEPTVDSMVAAMVTLCDKPESDRAALRAAAHTCYRERHTEAAFAAGYRTAVTDIARQLLPTRFS